MMKYFLKRNKGFTLLEALVAISILMVAVAAPITIAQKGLSSAVFSKDQMIASYLAQDAIEYIKNRRDVATINNENFDWNSFVSDFADCIDPSSCAVDTITNSSTDVIIDNEDRVLIKDSNGFYQYKNPGDDTKFFRSVNMKQNPFTNTDDEILLTVTVRWGAVGDSDKTLEVKTLMYNY